MSNKITTEFIEAQRKLAEEKVLLILGVKEEPRGGLLRLFYEDLVKVMIDEAIQNYE